MSSGKSVCELGFLKHKMVKFNKVVSEGLPDPEWHLERQYVTSTTSSPVQSFVTKDLGHLCSGPLEPSPHECEAFHKQIICLMAHYAKHSEGDHVTVFTINFYKQ